MSESTCPFGVRLCATGYDGAENAGKMTAVGSRGQRTLLAAFGVLLVLVIGSAIAFLLLAKTHPGYELVMARLEREPRVSERIGQPFEPSFWIYAKVFRGSGTWQFDVIGPRGALHVDASAKRIDQKWRLERVAVQPEGDRAFTLPTK